MPGLHGLDGDARVPVIRGRDDDGIDLRAREHLAVIARGEDTVAPDFFGPRQAAVIYVGDRDDLHAGNAERRPRVAHPLQPCPDERNLDRVERGHGRKRLRPLRKGMDGQCRRRGGHSRRAGGGDLQEFTARSRIVFHRYLNPQ